MSQRTGYIRKPFDKWCSENNPELLAEWHPIKNLPLTPSSIGKAYKGKLWWLGKCGHEWEATLGSRYKSGCPICSNLKVLAGFNDLATTNPDLARQWHPTKNGDLKPSDVIAGSTRRVWWICDKGHSWDAPINERNDGNGCPICSGKRVLVGVNDLATVNPRVAAEWHPTKNGNKTPKDYTAGSNKKVWWMCQKGHEWQAVICSRNTCNNCPYCGNQILLPGFNDLATVRPDWAAEWHPTKNGDVTPSQIFPSTGKKYWWICKEGHEWKSSPNNRMKTKGCPYCSGDRAIPKKTDLATLYPELVKEWHPTKNLPLTPDVMKPKSGKTINWVCPKGHEWKAKISDRVNGNGCPFCSGRRLIPEENSLAVINPELAAEWHPTKNYPLTPYDVKPAVAKKVWWKCKKGHEWEALISDRSRNKGCPYCALGRQASYNEKAILVCLQKTFPQIKFESNYTKFRKQGISELDIYVPELSIGIEYDGPRHTNHERDNKKSAACKALGIRLYRVKEHLRKGDESLFEGVFAWVSDHAQANEMNPLINRLESEIASLANIKEWKSHADLYKYRSEINELLIVHPEKSLEEVHPEIAKQWHPTKNGTLLPSEVYYASNKKAWWKCEKGHEWEAVINSRSKTGCPYCSNRRVIVGENDLATTNPELVSEWHPTKNGDLKPTDVVAGTNKKVWWLGKCGHEWCTTINIRAEGKGCPYCNGRRTFTGYNDLQTKNPELAAEWHPTKNGDLKPTDVASTVNKKVSWLGKCGHEWEASIGSRNRGNGCPYCGGFKAIPGKTDLATIKPEIAAEWHPTKNGNLKPTDVTSESHEVVWWICPKGHEWQKVIHGRGACPYCSGKLLPESQRRIDNYSINEKV